MWRKSLIALAVAAVAMIGSAAAPAVAQVNWRAYEGTDIRFMANSHPWTDYIQPQLGEFEALTGIDVQFEVLPEDQFRNRLLIELAGGAGSVDGFMIMPAQEGRQFSQARWMEPLGPYMEDLSLTDGGWDVDDFFGGAIRSGRFDGVQTSIPVQIETSLFAYRTDLFDEYGVDIPNTMEELEQVAKQLTLDTDGDGQTDIYGVTMRGKRAAATSQWVEFLYSYGGEWLHPNGSAAVGSPESIASLDMYGRLLRNYGPPGPTNLHWYESTSLFMQGKAAMIFDANVFKSLYDDPQDSAVVGKVGYFPIPAGPAGSVPHVATWDLAVSSQSRHKEATWLFLQWATNQEHQLGALLDGVPAARESAWRSPEFTAGESATDWIEASLKAYETGNPVWNPPVTAVAEVRDAVGLAIVAAIEGDDVAAAARKAAEETDAIIARTERR